MKNPKALHNLFYFSALLIISGILLKVSNYHTARYVYLAGACLFTLARVIYLVNNRENNKGRILHIQVFSGILLIVSAYFMYVGSNSWSAFVLISALIELYASFRGGNFQEKT